INEASVAYQEFPESAEAESTNPSFLASVTLPRPPKGLFAGRRGLLVGLGLGLAIAFIGPRLLPGRQDEAAQPPATETTAAAQSVSVSPAQMTSINQTLDTTGTVQAYDLLAVAPQISGLQIRSVLVREGDRVAAGQPLAILDDVTLQAEIREAEAEVVSAQAQVRQQQAALAQAEASQNEANTTLTRYNTLAERGAISQEELDSRTTEAVTTRESVGVARANVDSAQANVTSQQANLARLQAQLNQTVVRAPAPGTIAESNATQGDASSTSNALFQLIRADQLELEVDVPQTQLSQVAIGAPVTITANADDRIQLEGTVSQINPLVNADTRIATVTVSLPSSALLRPGMFLNAEVVTGSRQGVTVPAEAVLPQSDGTYQVYQLNSDDTVTAQTVDIGDRLPTAANQPAQIEITQGLNPGAQVVSNGASYLQDGDRVNVVKAQ
ncbi:MAG: efflux RND transporter periplasmic adaptor subunit, partial [Cyanobacteria bacterium J06642_9]